jgi:hypothetical protein
MSIGFALWRGDTRDVGWGELFLGADGGLSLGVPGGSAQVGLDPTTAPYVDAYVAQDWLCAVGGADAGLVLGLRDGPQLAVVAELERSQAGDRFAFDRHSLRFHDRVGHDQCILSWEIGVALVDRNEGLVWSYVHADVNQRLVKITAETVQLRGLYQSISVSLDDGTAAVDEFAPPPTASGETLAEWMRGIGR